MASIALDPAYRRVGVEEFLAMDFGGAKAELIDGIIFMMAGGTPLHSLIAGNVYVALRQRLRGSGCLTYNSDVAARTGEQSIRYPDVSVYCTGPLSREEENKQLRGDPQVVVEVLSPSTSSIDQKDKQEEYRALAGVREIIFVDPRNERIRLVYRQSEEWRDRWIPAGSDLHIPSLDLTIPHTDIFTRD